MFLALIVFILERLLVLLRETLKLHSRRMPFPPWRPQAPNSSTSQTPRGPLMHPPRRALTENQRRMYKLEKEENFRWIARLLSSPSSRVLTSDDLVQHDLQREIADIGQYAEIAHGSIDPKFVWRHLNRLVSPRFPLEGYDALVGSILVHVFHGPVARLRGYIAYRPETRQLVVAFSGTSNSLQALHDVDARMVRYPMSEGSNGTSNTDCKAHRGMWKMFQGIRQVTFKNFFKALDELDVAELVFTGHSLGAAQASLLAMEILQNNLDTKREGLPPGLIIKLVGFGSPRVGNEALARSYNKLISVYREVHGKDSFQEHFVKGYNDGVPCLPPKAMGFRHLCSTPLYLFHGRLFQIPPLESEHSVFPVQLGDDDTQALEHPLGGHNYYNNRDMERLQRHMKCLKLLAPDETGWEERYLQHLSKESRGRT